MTADEPRPEPPPTFDQSPLVGVVELDRFCVRCGYNLRQQPVRLEPTTSLLMCRCPECGAFEPANQATTVHRSWLGFFVQLLGLLWIAGWLGLIAGSIATTVSLSVGVSEASAYTHRLDEPVLLEPRPGESHSRQINYEYRMRELDAETFGLLALFLAGSFAVGAAMTGLTTIFLPHWPRRGYTRLAIGWPMIALIIMALTLITGGLPLEEAAQGLKAWLIASTALIGLLAIIGGVAAAWLGRPVARQAVRLIIPPKRRGPFAYLWLVDKKAVPATPED